MRITPLIALILGLIMSGSLLSARAEDQVIIEGNTIRIVGTPNSKKTQEKAGTLQETTEKNEEQDNEDFEKEKQIEKMLESERRMAQRNKQHIKEDRYHEWYAESKARQNERNWKRTRRAYLRQNATRTS